MIYTAKLPSFILLIIECSIAGDFIFLQCVFTALINQITYLLHVNKLFIYHMQIYILFIYLSHIGNFLPSFNCFFSPYFSRACLCCKNKPAYFISQLARTLVNPVVKFHTILKKKLYFSVLYLLPNMLNHWRIQALIQLQNSATCSQQ